MCGHKERRVMSGRTWEVRSKVWEDLGSGN